MSEDHARYVRAYFRNFAEFQAPTTGSPLYERLSWDVLEDPHMLELAELSPAGQPPANLLYGAVHYLLLRGARHPLRDWYPDVLDDPARARAADAETYPAFRAFVAEHRDEVEALMRTRLVQTNVVRRATALLPCFAHVASSLGAEGLALLEIGPSAGLNLHWDRHRYVYESEQGRASWGAAQAALCLSTEVRSALPPLPAPGLRVAWRRGVDVHPIDVRDDDAVLWLRALIFPEHVERHAELAAATQAARREPVPLIKGDASVLLPELMATAPADAELCLFATMVLYQLDAAARARISDHLRAESRTRRVSLISFDGRADGTADLTWQLWRDGHVEERKLGECQPHGRWLRWLQPSDTVV